MASKQPDHYRFVYLLTALLSLMVLAPFIAGDRPAEHPGVLAALGIAVFATAIGAVARTRGVRLIAAVLAAPAIAGNLMVVAAPAYHMMKPTILFGIVFLGFVTTVIFHGVVATEEVTTETLYGAVTGYLLLGLMWSEVYLLIEQLWPGSFKSLINPDGRLMGPDFAFFSFITLTSVGYGDIVPVGGHARSLAMLEAVAGQLYLAVFIARLVGLSGQRGRPSAPP